MLPLFQPRCAQLLLWRQRVVRPRCARLRSALLLRVQQPDALVRLPGLGVVLLFFSAMRSASALAAASCSASMRSASRRCASARSTAWRFSILKPGGVVFRFRRDAVGFCFGSSELFGLDALGLQALCFCAFSGWRSFSILSQEALCFRFFSRDAVSF